MMDLKDELVQLGFVPTQVRRIRQTWVQSGQRRVVLLGDHRDTEKLRKLRRRSFHRCMRVSQD